MIPYQLVSTAAILRDWLSEEDQVYKSEEQRLLAGVADYLYNVGGSPDELLPEYKAVYDQYGPEYFAKVLDDMQALDSQLTNSDAAMDLFANYLTDLGYADDPTRGLEDTLLASTQIIASRRNPKTKEVKVLQGNYGYGWDDLCEYELDDPSSRSDFKSYRENEPQYAHRIIYRRVPNPNYVEPNPELATDMEVYQLRDAYMANNPDGHFFDKETLKFFGERWSEMRVSPQLVEVKDYRGTPHLCYELVTRQHKAPGGTRTAYHYFDKDTFQQIDAQ